MNISFLFGWAEGEGITLPTKADGSVNIPASFDLYNEWHKKQITAKRASLRDRGVDTDGMSDSEIADKHDEFTGGGKRGKIKLTRQEWAQYYRFVNDPQNKGAISIDKSGSRYVRLENKIVVDDGVRVLRVVVFPSNDAMNDFINHMTARGRLKWV